MTFAMARSVRVAILINYHSLLADRGRGVKELCEIIASLFGTARRFIEARESTCAVVTQAPCVDDDGELVEAAAVRALLLDTSGVPAHCAEVLEALKDRTFVYHPLDKGTPSWTTRKQLLDTIKHLNPIKDAAGLFKTVLTLEDEHALRSLLGNLVTSIEEDFDKSSYGTVAARLNQMLKIDCVDNSIVHRILQDATHSVRSHFSALVRSVNQHIMQSSFDAADHIIKTAIIPATAALITVNGLRHAELVAQKDDLVNFLKMRREEQARLVELESKMRRISGE